MPARERKSPHTAAPSIVDHEALMEAVMFTSGGMDTGLEAYVELTTGRVLLHGDPGEGDFDPLPADIDDPERYLHVPSKRDLDLGRELALDFTEEHLPADLDAVVGIFSKRGAFPRFKDLLYARDALDRWYAYENSATEKAVEEWAERNGLRLGKGE